MKHRFMGEHRGIHSVERMAGVLEVSRSGYYSWLNRDQSDRESTVIQKSAGFGNGCGCIPIENGFLQV